MDFCSGPGETKCTGAGKVARIRSLDRMRQGAVAGTATLDIASNPCDGRIRGCIRHKLTSTCSCSPTLISTLRFPHSPNPSQHSLSIASVRLLISAALMPPETHPCCPSLRPSATIVGMDISQAGSLHPHYGITGTCIAAACSSGLHTGTVKEGFGTGNYIVPKWEI